MKKIFYKDKIIETFIFDLDGTAFGSNDSIASINAECKVLAHIGNCFPEIKIQDLYKLSQKFMQIDRKKWFCNVLNKIKHQISNINFKHDIENLASDMETLYWVTFTQSNIPYSDFLYFIKRIKSYCNLAIITDGHIKNQKIKIFSSELHNYFDFNNIVFSDEINFKKPSKEIFDYAQKKIGYKQYSTVYIGDLLDKDIAGANNAGLVSVFFKRGTNIHDVPKTQNQIPDITISNYFELFDVFKIREA